MANASDILLPFNCKDFYKEEAEVIFDLKYDGPRTKDYWLVYDLHDNLEHLQSLLDAMYNIKSEPNIYDVGYVENQSNCRLIIKCMVCRKDLSSYDPFKSHDQGRAHKKSVANVRNKENENPNIGCLVFKSFENLFQPSKLYPEDSLEACLDKSDKPVFGVHLMFAEEMRDINCYTCRICATFKSQYSRMMMNEAFNHIVSDIHIKNYFMMKYRIPFTSEKTFISMVNKERLKEGKFISSITVLKNSHIPKKYQKKQISSPDNLFSVLSSKFPKISGVEVGMNTDEVTDNVGNFCQEMENLQNDLCVKQTHHQWIRHYVNTADSCINCYLLRVVAMVLTDKLTPFAQDKENFLAVLNEFTKIICSVDTPVEEEYSYLQSITSE